MTRRPIPWLLVVCFTLAAPRSLAQTGIDLTMTSLTGAPASAGVGKSFTVRNTVKTTGAVSKSFTVGLYLSTDNVITTSDTLIASRTVASLKANASSTATTTVTVPTSLAPGTYYVGAIADSTNAIAETNEANNAIVGTQISIVGADLTMTSLTGAPASVAAGGSFSLTNTVAAASTGGNAGAFTVGFYLSTDSVITTADSSIGTRAVTSLAAGGTSSATTTVTVPASLAAGSYYVGAIADSANQVIESNESNNSIVGTQIQVLKPDLTVTSLTGAPATAALGSTFSVSSTVANAAGGAASGAFTVGFYLSADSVITTSDTSIGSRSVTSLAAGATSTAATTVTVPAGLAPGTYYLGAIADSANQISESNEANNAILGSQIQVGPDLTMTSLTGAPASVNAGGGFNLTSTVAASAGGAVGAFTVGFYLSTDNITTTTDTLIGTRAASSLSAGGTSTAATAVSVPGTLAPGSYYVGAIADSTSQVAEASETNNAIVASAQIQVIGPDLSMTSLSAAPYSIGVGDSFSVTDTVANGAGVAAAGPFYVGYYFSTDGSITSSDLLIGSRSVSAGLAAGQADTATTILTVPVGVAPGTYYFGAIADYSNLVPEANKSNNSVAAGLVVVGAYSCQHPATPIDDGNPCTIDSCDPLTGVLHVPALAGTPCPDGDVCNGLELCDGGGTCRPGTPLVVDDGNPCTADSCDPVTGVSHVPAALETLCDDGNACTYADACNGSGACLGTLIICTSDTCNQRACNGTSSCTVTPRTGQACDDGDPCSYGDTCNAGGSCVGTPLTCASDACNQRSCNGTASCTATPLPGNPCDDGNPCTYGDTCNSGGLCVGTPVSCVSRGPCEQVQCNGSAACGTTLVARGTACSAGNTCGQVCDGVSPNCQPAE